jgi:hypothetical protein
VRQRLGCRVGCPPAVRLLRPASEFDPKLGHEEWLSDALRRCEALTPPCMFSCGSRRRGRTVWITRSFRLPLRHPERGVGLVKTAVTWGVTDRLPLGWWSPRESLIVTPAPAAARTVAWATKPASCKAGPEREPHGLGGVSEHFARVHWTGRGQSLRGRGRIPDRQTLEREVAAWEAERNRLGGEIDWRFTTEDARIKLKRLYPSQGSPDE